MSIEDIHRCYPHTRELFGATLHNVKWGLINVRHKAARDYIVNTRHLWVEPQAAKTAVKVTPWILPHNATRAQRWGVFLAKAMGFNVRARWWQNAKAG